MKPKFTIDSLLMTRREFLFANIIIVCISFLFLLIHSVSTSPLFITSYSDSEVFMVLGKFFLMGEVPYVDYFDHKGPVIIFIEALGLLLHSDMRTGVFILQIIFLSVTLCFMYNTLRVYLNRINSSSIILFTLCYLMMVLDNGNLTEEYSLLFIYTPVFFTLKYLLNKNFVLSPFQMIVIGACIGVLIWIRLNNVAVVGACSLFLIICYLMERDWKSLIKFIGYASAGVLLISSLIVIYFCFIEALDEMLYATFTFNLKYAISADEFQKTELSPLLMWRVLFIYSVPFVILLIGTVLFYFRNKDKKILLLSTFLCVLSLGATVIGLRTIHYLMIALPLVTIGLLYVILSRPHLRRQTSYLILIIALILSLGLTGLKFMQNRNVDDSTIIYKKEALEVLDKIPTAEREKMFSYRTSIAFSNLAGTKPYFKYFISQERHGAVDSKIFEDINRMMEENSPKWLVIEYKEASEYNPHFFEIRDEKYDLYFENETFLLYRLKTTD